MNKTRGMGCEQKCVSSAWAQWPLFPTFPPVFKTQPQNLLLHWNALHKIQVTLCTLFLRMPRICLHESRKKVKSFSPVRLFVTPWTVAYQAPPSMEFSKQEYWSGLPFPSTMRESEVTQSCPTLSDPMDCSLPGSSVHGILQARVLEWGAIAFSILCH